MARKPKAQDRQFMDAAGAPAPAATADTEVGKNIFEKQAEDDKLDAKARHANKGLRAAKDLIATMQKAVAHGLASESDGVKAACLEEVADLGNAVRDGARAALRAATKETRNLQA